MSKLSELLNEFTRQLEKFPDGAKQKFYSGVKASFGPVKSTRTTALGEKVDTRDVDFTAIADVVPPDLRQDWREIQRELLEQGRKRGAQWSDESFAYILSKFLLPKPTPAELAATPELVAAVAKQLPSLQPPSIDLDKLAEMVAAKLQGQKPAA